MSQGHKIEKPEVAISLSFFHSILMKLGWCIDISIYRMPMHLQGHRVKVKITRRQSLKIVLLALHDFSDVFVFDPSQI